MSSTAQSVSNIQFWIFYSIFYVSCAQATDLTAQKQQMAQRLTAVQQKVFAEAQAAAAAKAERGELQRQLDKVQKELAEEREGRQRAERVMLEMQSRQAGKVQCPL